MSTLSKTVDHFPEYLCEATGLGTFMVSACIFAAAIYNPESVVHVPDKWLADSLMGAAMGITLILIIFSPFGQRSGAHLNPAVTLTFYRLGKVERGDALFYIVAQFAGGTIGVLASWLLLGRYLENAAVNFVVTVPGRNGTVAAFAGEFAISFVMMTMVLTTTNSRALMRFTPYFAGVLLSMFILFEARISGTSMNPARTFASSSVSGIWTSSWIYFSAPVLAMMLAGELYRILTGLKKIHCAKLHHQNRFRCIFCGKPTEKLSPLR